MSLCDMFNAIEIYIQCHSLFSYISDEHCFTIRAITYILMVKSIRNDDCGFLATKHAFSCY